MMKLRHGVCRLGRRTLDKRPAIKQYRPCYYHKVGKPGSRKAGIFRIVDTNPLDKRDFQPDLPEFYSLPIEARIVVRAHIHQS